MDVSEIHNVHHVSTTGNTEEGKKKEKTKESHTRRGMQVRQCGQSRKGFAWPLSTSISFHDVPGNLLVPGG